MAKEIRLGATVNNEPSLTRQADADACDINNIMKRYERTGILPPYASAGYFADVSEMGDFHHVTEVVRQTTDIFMQLPAKVRAEYQNDVANFVNWACDPSNAEGLKSLLDGAEKAPEVPPPVSEPGGDAPVGG